MKKTTYVFAVQVCLVAAMVGGCTQDSIWKAEQEEKKFATEAEPAPPAEPEEAAAPPTPPRPAPRRIGLEERFGTQWVVWAGGIGDVARH